MIARGFLRASNVRLSRLSPKGESPPQVPRALSGRNKPLVRDHAKDRCPCCDRRTGCRPVHGGAGRGFRPSRRALPYRHTVRLASPASAALYARQSARRMARSSDSDARYRRRTRNRAARRCLAGPRLSEPGAAGDLRRTCSGRVRRNGRSAIRTFSRRLLPRSPPARISAQCQQPLDANAMVGRISATVSPTAEQMPLLQKLGGALGMASGYLARACPKDIPPQPVARLQMMQSQIQTLAMAVDIVHQPLQDFAQSLTPDQLSRFDGTAAPQATQAAAPSTGSKQPSKIRTRPATSCRLAANSSTAIDWSIEQINRSVQPTAAQRDDLADRQTGLQCGGNRPRRPLPGFGAGDRARTAGNYRGAA